MAAANSGASNQWSWGAFTFGPAYLIAIKKYIMLLWYLLVLIPFVGPLLILIFHIVIGIKGREMGSASPAFANKDEFNGFQKAIDHAGLVLFVVYLVIFILSFAVAGLGIFSALLGGGAGVVGSELLQ